MGIDFDASGFSFSALGALCYVTAPGTLHFLGAPVLAAIVNFCEIWFYLWGYVDILRDEFKLSVGVGLLRR